MGTEMPTLGDICCTNKHLFLEANILAVTARVLMAGNNEGKIRWSALTRTDGDKFLLLAQRRLMGEPAYSEPLN